MHVNIRHERGSVVTDHLWLNDRDSSTKNVIKFCHHFLILKLFQTSISFFIMWPAGLCDSSESLLMRRETCAIISVCLSSLDHRRGSQIWFMICCLMARALALRGDQMTFSTGACQGRNGECTITTAWQREWERPPVLLRLNGGEMLLKSDGKMIPVNTAKDGGWSADTDDVMLTEFWSLGKAANCYIKHTETIMDTEMQSNDLDVISCIISPNLSSMSRHESSIVSEVDMMVSTLNRECWLTWAWKLLRTGETISNTS